MKIIKNGNFSSWFRVFLVLFGISIFVSSYLITDGIVMAVFALLGMLVLAIGSFSEQANFFGLKPFGTSWKKIRKTYEKKDDGA